VFNDVFGIAKQVDLATKQTVMEYFPGIESGDTGFQQTRIEQAETTGSRFPEGGELGTEYWAPTFTGPVRYGSLPRILSAFWGAPVTTTPDGVGAPTGRKHAFESGLPLPHSLLCDAKDANPSIVDLYFGALGNTLTLSVDPAGFMKWQAAWVAMGLDDTQADPVVVRDVTKRISFAKAKAFISVNGGAESEIKVGSWSLEYSNGITPDDFILGQNTLYTVQEGNASATVKFAPRESLSSHYRRALLQNPDTVKIRLTATGALIGGAINYQVEVIVNACEYINAPIALSAADRLKVVNVEAAAKIASNGKFVSANVINEVTAY
jgi:hypothetical protein